MGTIAPLAMIVVVHHTDCGGLCTTDEEDHLRLRERAPSHAHEIKYAIWHLFLVGGMLVMLFYPCLLSQDNADAEANSIDESLRQDVAE